MDSRVTDLLEICDQLAAFKSKASRSLGRAWSGTKNCRKALKGIQAAGQASELEIEQLEMAILAQAALFANINYRLHRRVKSLSWEPFFVELSKKHRLPRINKGTIRWCDIPLELQGAVDNFSGDERNKER